MIIYTNRNYKDLAKRYRKDLVKNSTECEKIYKKYLSRKNIKYEFQKIIFYDSGFYIVDFYIPEFNLIVEIDGGYHNNKEQIIKDRHRTFMLKQKGFTVKRYTNDEIIKKCKINN